MEMTVMTAMMVGEKRAERMVRMETRTTGRRRRMARRRNQIRK